MRLSPHFHVDEFTRSQVAVERRIINAPDRCALASMRLLCIQLELLRASVGRPIEITSGFRTPQLDRAVGGSGSGQHTLGEAADIHVDGMSSLDLARHIRALDLEVDQVIGYAESAHVHVSHRAAGSQRKQFLWCVSRSGKQFETWSVGGAP